MPAQKGAYELLDSGEREKLERFGDRILIRPSSWCVWKRRKAAGLWNSAHARYEHERGWMHRGTRFDEWCFESEFGALELRLQSNGQVGIFPEHAQYLDVLVSEVKRLSGLRGAPTRVLNLFAYTGMASVACLKAQAHVTHVDLSKKALEWARRNFELSGVDKQQMRLIREDAVLFVQREVKRGREYDIVVADPPSFSRISEREEWNLEEVLAPMIADIARLLAGDAGALFLTNHHFESGGHVMANLVRDGFAGRAATVETRELLLKESDSDRVLPAGFLVQTLY